MWVCYIGEISESYLENWSPHTVGPDQTEPEVFDVLTDGTRQEIGYRLDMSAAEKCFSDRIQVDWGGWAYKVTSEQIRAYNQATSPQYQIPECELDPEKAYAIIDVECY